MIKQTRNQDIANMDRILQYFGKTIQLADKLARNGFNRDKILLKQKDEICTICQCDLDIATNLKILSCGHEFHANCITKYFQDYNFDTCPNCNQVETFINIRAIIVQKQLVRKINSDRDSTSSDNDNR